MGTPIHAPLISWVAPDSLFAPEALHAKLICTLTHVFTMGVIVKEVLLQLQKRVLSFSLEVILRPFGQAEK